MVKLARAAILILSFGILATAQSALTIPTTSLPAGATGSPYSVLLAAAGGTPPYSWSASGLPPSFTISSSGILSGTPSANGVGTFSIIVTVTDPASHSASAGLDLVINPGFLIVTQSLPNGSLGASYSQVIQASGGTPPYSFSLSPSTIFFQSSPPPGLTLSPSGLVTGVPTKIGSYSFGVTAMDSANNQATATYTVFIGTQPVFSTASPLPFGVVGTYYANIIFANGGTPPYDFSIVGSAPPGLSINAAGVLSGTPSQSGTFSFVVRVLDAHQISATKQYQVTFSGAPSLLQTSALAVDFTAAVGGDAPPAQSIAITSINQSRVSYSVTVDGGTANLPAPSWLSVTPTTGVTPGRLTLRVNQGSMQAANLSGAIHISGPGGVSQAPISIVVTFEISSGAPQLEVVPNILTFASRTQTPGVLSQNLMLRNRGGSGSVAFAVSTLTSPRPLHTSVSATAGSTVLNSPTFLQVQIDTTGLAIGHYRDVIEVSWLGGTIQIPVTLFVSDQGPILDLGLKGVRFSARAGNGNSSIRHINVINRGDAASPIHWSADLIIGQEWLTLPVASGTATVFNPGTLWLQPGPAVAGLPVGPRYALVRVSDPQALNSPQYLAAVVDNVSASDPPVPSVESGGLVFSTSVGSTQPMTGQLTIEASSATAVTVSTAVFTANGTNWLSVSPASAPVSTAGPATITITVSPAGLNGGTYTGEVDVAIGSELRTLNVTFIITNLTIVPCAPSRLVLTPTGLTTSFSVPMGWASPLRAQVNDDCGNLVRNAQVVASFTNGDVPLPLQPDGGNGTYSASWAPGVAMAQMNLTLRASADSLQTTNAQLIGDVYQNEAPIMAKNGALNNLNPQVGGALAPGLVVQVFGSGLAVNTNVTSIPANALNGTSLLAAGLPAPLYYVSQGQLAAQIPFELAANQQYAIIASVNGALTLPDTIDVNPVSPGVAAFSDGSLAAEHADYSLVDPQNPAHPGEVVTMYLVGLGVTSPSVTTGYPPPSAEPFARPIYPPSVSIDGKPAQISFAGLSPYSVGLYQINFQVPVDARTGIPLSVVVIQGGVTANVTTLTLAP